MKSPIIIGLSGKKQSGKDTVCQGLEEWFLSNYHPFEYSFEIYGFADSLKKQVCINTMGLTEKQCYGTDEEKNSLTKFKWENLPDDIRYSNNLESEKIRKIGTTDEYEDFPVLRKGFMTAREIMQVIGTDIFRNYFDDNIWVDSTFRKISYDNRNLALISDVRFPSEVNAILNHNGCIIRLTRNICEQDEHPSETALDNYDFDNKEKVCIINNENINIDEQNKIAIDYVKKILENK